MFNYLVHRPVDADEGYSMFVQFTTSTPLTYQEAVTRADAIPTDYWYDDDDYITNEEGGYCVEVGVNGEWDEVR